MKQRNSLVSNSSSTSFIVAYKENKCPTCGKSNICTIDHIKTLCDDCKYNYEWFGEGKDSVSERVKSEFYEYCDEDKKFKENLIQQIQSLSDSMNVAYFQISHHDSKLLDELDMMEKNKSIQILYKGEG